MKTKMILSALLIFIIQLSFAQKNSQDVVYLKNGSVIRGFIIEFIPEKNVKIKTEGQNVFVFEMSEVDKITREEPPVAKKEFKPSIKEKGYFNETEFSLLIGKGSSKFTTGQSLTTVNGFRVNRFLRIGAGAGATHYNDYSNTFIPVFGRVSGDILRFWVTPIYFADAGYGFLVEKDQYTDGAEEISSKGGLMIHAGLGLKFYTPYKASFTLTAGFNLQKSTREYQYTYSEGNVYKEKRTYQRMTFGLGMNF